MAIDPRLLSLKNRLGAEAPRVFLIPGNDDPRAEEEAFLEGEASGAWEYLACRKTDWDGRAVYGYPFVPPPPFRLKDWERYDVSPEEGVRSVPVEAAEVRRVTIASDLERLAGGDDLGEAVFLFHGPPYGTLLDRAALDGRSVDHAPLDVHVGSVAIRRFVEARQPLLTLHGHIHESARLTGSWRDRIGKAWCLSAAHDGPELALVSLRPEAPEAAVRSLLEPY